jgi:hypothetical protein
MRLIKVNYCDCKKEHSICFHKIILKHKMKNKQFYRVSEKFMTRRGVKRYAEKTL